MRTLKKIRQGVYIITSQVDEKIYVGSSYDCLTRWKAHLSDDQAHSAAVKTYTLLSSQNERITVVNLKQFCRERKFHYPRMCGAANGEQPYKGWTKG
jgi:predicted GIY-YIG superfamily endonuclease